jgi:hypothetical protein
MLQEEVGLLVDSHETEQYAGLHEIVLLNLRKEAGSCIEDSKEIERECRQAQPKLHEIVA